jgi:hypothetical protein
MPQADILSTSKGSAKMTGSTNIRGRVAGMIRLAANDELPTGWLYLPKGEITADTECVLLLSDTETDDLRNTGATLGFPVEGLATDDLKDIFHGAQRLIANPSDSVLVRAFNYYLEFDAYLPSIDAPDPPSSENTLATLDRQFYQSLGAEREGTLCRKAGCERGSVALSVFCRPHHFESVKQRPCPFHD